MKQSSTTNKYMNKRKSLLPNDFYQKLFEAENKFQSYPSMQSCEELLLIYKQGTEYFGNISSKEHNYFINAIQKIVSAQMTTKILSNKNDNKTNKKYHPNIKNQVAMFNLEQYDYKPDIKNIIDNCENSMKKSLDYLNKNINSQKTNFRKNIRKKIFKSRFEKINEDEEEEKEKENENIIFNSGSKVKIKNEFIIHDDFKRKRQRYNSISRLNYPTKNFMSLSQTSFFKKPKRKISINSDDGENNNNNILNKTRNRTYSEIFDDNIIKKIPKKNDFHHKQDLSQDLIQFLKNYSVKLHYLFQTPLNDTLNILNDIFDKNYVEMKNQYFEYEENVKGYLALCEDPNQEPFKTLIESLKTELNESLFLINTGEENEIKTLTEKNIKNNLVDMITISNLNDDTIAQIAEIFK